MKQSLRVIDNSPVLQDIVEDKAKLFAQLAISTVKREKAEIKHVIQDNTMSGKIIVPVNMK